MEKTKMFNDRVCEISGRANDDAQAEADLNILLCDSASPTPMDDYSCQIVVRFLPKLDAADVAGFLRTVAQKIEATGQTIQQDDYHGPLVRKLVAR
jgi:hypothetical protein